jgi:CHAT domain-containing protein
MASAPRERLRSRSLGADAIGDPRLDELYLEDNTHDPQPLPVSEMHLIYASFREGVQIWTVDGPDVKSTWVEIGQERLKRQIKEFAEQCAHKSAASDRGAELYARLVQPVESRLPFSRPVVVELDQNLSQLPLEALPLPGSEKEFFGAKYQVVRSPGIFAEKNLRALSPLPAGAPFLLVDPAHETGHPQQVEAVRHAFPGARVMDAMDVKQSQILQALSTSYGFHFTGHGSGTALYLNSGLDVTAADFSQASLRKVQLAVLAACSTNSTLNGTLDPDNLVRSFLRAGVPSVIASQWKVDAASTAELMSSFYSHLGKGDSPALALQKARREMAGAPSRNNPYYWAAFTLTGRAD